MLLINTPRRGQTLPGIHGIFPGKTLPTLPADLQLPQLGLMRQAKACECEFAATGGGAGVSSPLAFSRTQRASRASMCRKWSLTSLREWLIKIGRQGRQTRLLHRLPDGRGRHPSADVPEDFAADC